MDMVLSSLRRLRLYAAGMGEEPISDELKNNRTLTGWLNATSDQVQNYLSRGIKIKERIEYVNLQSGQKEYWIDATPIIDLSNVSYDSTGLWDGSGESELSTHYIGSNEESVVVGTELGISVLKGLRITYTGGLAYHAVNSVFNMAEVIVWTVNNWVQGATSGAVGRIVSKDGLTLTVENYYGIFEKDETLQEYTTADCTTEVEGLTSTISSISKQSLAEKYPSIVSAVEAQIRYYWNHMTDFENAGTDKEGSTIRQTPKTQRKYPFIDEVLDLLEPYRKTY